MNTPSIIIATFYKFVTLPDVKQLRETYKSFMLAHNLRGTILLAEEGINATVSGSRNDIDALLNTLRADPRFSDLSHKESFYDEQPFQRAKVRLKREVISLGIPANPNEKVGTYVEPKDWNALIDDPDVTVLDTRNFYETQLGTFQHALDPQTLTFKELPSFTKEHLNPEKNKKIAIYCTGGIRCEKYSSYLMDQGFEEVYHLKGGILKYLEEVPEAESKWQGECFVFDDRVALSHRLKPTYDAGHCDACKHPLAITDRAHPHFIAGKQCPHCTLS